MSPLRILDVACSTALIIFVTGGAIIYTMLAARRGRRHYDRVDKQGSSKLLSKSVMELGYWSMQSCGRSLARRGLTPNQISALSLLMGIGAGVFLALGLFGVGAFLATLSGFLDLLDGMVARATGVSSDAGEVLDAAIDRYTEYFFFGGLVIYYHAYPLLQVITLLAMAGSSMVTYSTAKAEALHVTVPSAMMRRHERSAYLVLGAGFSAFSMATVERGMSFDPALGLPMLAAIAFIGVLANIAAVRRLRAVAIAVGAAAV